MTSINTGAFSRVYLLFLLKVIVVMIMLDITAAISFSKKNIKNYLLFPVTTNTINNHKVNIHTPMIETDVSINNKNDNNNNDDDVPSSINLCRICKTYYNPLQNTMKSCRFHKGRWMGAENSKHMGTRSGGDDKGLSLFWDCCDAGLHGLGCSFVSDDQTTTIATTYALFLISTIILCCLKLR